MHLTSISLAPQDTSLPVGVFVWEIENQNEHDLEVSLMFTLRNGTGTKDDQRGGHWNEPFHLDKEESISGVLLHHCTPVNSYTMAISAKHTVSKLHHITLPAFRITFGNNLEFLLNSFLNEFITLGWITSGHPLFYRVNDRLIKNGHRQEWFGNIEIVFWNLVHVTYRTKCHK